MIDFYLSGEILVFFLFKKLCFKWLINFFRSKKLKYHYCKKIDKLPGKKFLGSCIAIHPNLQPGKMKRFDRALQDSMGTVSVNSAI